MDSPPPPPPAYRWKKGEEREGKREERKEGGKERGKEGRGGDEERDLYLYMLVVVYMA